MSDDLFHCERFVWLSFELGWCQKRSSLYSASGKSFETSRQTWFFSFWDGILSINSYHMRCKHEKTFTGIHVFLLVHFCSETTSVCIELISVCVESTLDVYQNRLSFVSKQLWIETSVHLSNPSQTALHIRRDALWDRYNMADRWPEKML